MRPSPGDADRGSVPTSLLPRRGHRFGGGEIVEPDGEIVASAFMVPDTALADVAPELRA
jgi:hypothetical protein